MRHRRVDWEEEIRKTNRIRRRGFALSALSLAVALGVIFGVDGWAASGAAGAGAAVHLC